MDIVKLVNVYPTRKVLLQTLKPSEILNLFVATRQLLTSAEKSRYLALEREVLKNTNIVDALVNKGGTVLLVGSDVKSLLSRFTSRHKSEHKDKTYHNVWVVCIRVLGEHEERPDPGYGTVHPVLQAMDIKWHEYGCGLYSGMCLCVRTHPDPFHQRLVFQPGGGSYGIEEFYNWHTTLQLAEHGVRLFANVGEYKLSEETGKVAFSPVVSIRCGSKLRERDRLLADRTVPYVDIGRKPNVVEYAKRHKALVRGHVPVTLNIVHKPGTSPHPITRFI